MWPEWGLMFSPGQTVTFPTGLQDESPTSPHVQRAHCKPCYSPPRELPPGLSDAVGPRTLTPETKLGPTFRAAAVQVGEKATSQYWATQTQERGTSSAK